MILDDEDGIFVRPGFVKDFLMVNPNMTLPWETFDDTFSVFSSMASCIGPLPARLLFRPRFVLPIDIVLLQRMPGHF